MKHILKVIGLLVVLTAFWIGLLETSVLPRNYALSLPVYLIVSLGCYGLLMVGVGLMLFPTCPHEAVLLQDDIVEAKKFLMQRGVDVESDWQSQGTLACYSFDISSSFFFFAVGIR